MNYNYKEDIEEQRTPVERIEAATDLLEQALDEIAPLHDTELTPPNRTGRRCKAPPL